MSTPFSPNTGLRTRVLKVTIDLPGAPVVLDQTLNMRVRIRKDALAIQNKAEIEITNLTGSVRQQLLSNFTAYQRNQRDTFGAQTEYWNVTVEAGYISVDGSDTTSVVYKGQVVMCDLVSGPPNVTVRISCYTNQVAKTTYITDPLPYQSTFRELVFWAGNYMGFDNNHIKCSTSFDNDVVINAARSIYVAAALLPYIQDAYHPRVAAFIDDDFLYVTDQNKVINSGDISQVSEFIGIPSWTEYGVEGEILLDPAIRLAGGVNFTSLLNPSLNGDYVITGLEYELTSRDTAFYCKISAAPPAA